MDKVDTMEKVNKMDKVRGHSWSKGEVDFMVQYVQTRREEARTKGFALTDNRLFTEAAEEIFRKFGVERTFSSCLAKWRYLLRITDHAGIDDSDNEKHGSDSDESDLGAGRIKHVEPWSDKEKNIVYMTIKERREMEFQNGMELSPVCTLLQLAHNCLRERGFTRTFNSVSSWWAARGRKHFNYDERVTNTKTNSTTSSIENAQESDSKDRKSTHTLHSAGLTKLNIFRSIAPV
jgi:hypothetical protein